MFSLQEVTKDVKSKVARLKSLKRRIPKTKTKPSIPPSGEFSDIVLFSDVPVIQHCSPVLESFIGIRTGTDGVPTGAAG